VLDLLIAPEQSLRHELIARSASATDAALRAATRKLPASLQVIDGGGEAEPEPKKRRTSRRRRKRVRASPPGAKKNVRESG